MELETALENFYHFGRMISGSKSFYSDAHPKNIVVFNANVCTETRGKIWYGDLDITRDSEKLKTLAKNLGETIYVLREMDARFENEANPKLDRARAVITANSVVINEYRI